MDSLRDTIARALGEARTSEPWDQDAYADAALSAIKAAGFAVVPVEPTEAMAKASAIRTKNPDGSRTTTWGISVWSAMIQAAQE